MNRKCIFSLIIFFTIGLLIGCGTAVMPEPAVPAATITSTPTTQLTNTIPPPTKTATVTPTEPVVPTPTNEPANIPNPTATVEPTPTITATPKKAITETAVIQATEWGASWLLTADDMNRIFADSGIIDWTVDNEMAGENRMYRMFSGISWSINPNFAANGIYRTPPDITFADIEEDLHTEGIILPDAVLLKSSYPYEGEAVLYGAALDNGHSAYDFLLINDGLLYWVGLSLGTPGGYNFEMLYEEYGGEIDALLDAMLQVNLTRNSSIK